MSETTSYKTNWFSLSLLVVSCSLLGLKAFVPMASVYMPGPVLTLLIVLIFLSIILNTNADKFFKYIGACLPVFAVEILVLLKSFVTPGESAFSAFVTLLLLIVWPVVTSYLIDYRNNNTIRRISRLLLLVFFLEILFTMITTYLGNKEFPGASRALAHYDINETGLVDVYTSMNIGGFSFIYMLTLILPLFVFLTKYNRKLRICGVAAIVMQIMCVISSQYTIALFMTLISMTMFLIPKSVQGKQTIVWVGAIIAILFFSSLFAELVISLSGAVEGNTLSMRLEEVSTILTGRTIDNSTDVATRIDLLNVSWNNFLNNPLLGSSAPVGGHSFLLDTLSRFGLLGLITLITCFRYLYKYYVKPYKSMYFYSYAVIAYIINLIQCFINTFNGFIAFTLILPVFTVAISYTSQYKVVTRK